MIWFVNTITNISVNVQMTSTPFVSSTSVLILWIQKAHSRSISVFLITSLTSSPLTTTKREVLHVIRISPLPSLAIFTEFHHHFKVTMIHLSLPFSFVCSPDHLHIELSHPKVLHTLFYLL